MLARSRQVRLRNDLEFSTPLLIPALSSRATGPIPFQHSPSGQPKMTVCSIVHSQTLLDGIEESLLVSAYDIGHRLLDDSAAFASGSMQSRYAKPQVLLIDSGWYEKSGGPPAGQFSGNVEEPRLWGFSNYESTIDTLDRDLRPIVVSWDYVGPYEEQISRAQDFFGGRTALGSTLLLKPPSKASRFHHFDRLSDADAANLRAFDIIGATERELGDSVLKRLIGISQLRQQLDSVGVQAPIHVFGGLDPLYTPLYFAAGAELFDGLGWLRYAYREGVAMNRDAGILLDGQITKRWLQSLLWVSLRNLDELTLLAEELRRYVHEDDWSAFRCGESLEPIFRSLQARTEEFDGR